MNILVLSAGIRNIVVRFFEKALMGCGIVIAADCSSYAPALYEADHCYVIPPFDAPDYLNSVMAICRKECVAGVLSLIDTESCIISQREKEFREIGVLVIGSSFSLCELALNKYLMYRWLVLRGYPTVRTWKDVSAFLHAEEEGNATFPVIMKPERGSASVGIWKAHDREAVSYYGENNSDVIIQEFITGQEIGADVYADMISGEVVSVFTKKKLRMRAGETDKSVSFKDPVLFDLIGRFVTEAGFRGPVDMDLFEVDGKYYISEVNPRFGGGYPHAHECGCDFTKLILNNLNGVANEPHIGDYEEGVYMMKYSDVMIRKETELTKQRGASVPL